MLDMAWQVEGTYAKLLCPPFGKQSQLLQKQHDDICAFNVSKATLGLGIAFAPQEALFLRWTSSMVCRMTGPTLRNV